MSQKGLWTDEEIRKLTDDSVELEEKIQRLLEGANMHVAFGVMITLHHKLREKYPELMTEYEQAHAYARMIAQANERKEEQN